MDDKTFKLLITNFCNYKKHKFYPSDKLDLNLPLLFELTDDQIDYIINLPIIHKKIIDQYDAGGLVQWILASITLIFDHKYKDERVIQLLNNFIKVSNEINDSEYILLDDIEDMFCDYTRSYVTSTNNCSSTANDIATKINDMTKNIRSDIEKIISDNIEIFISNGTFVYDVNSKTEKRKTKLSVLLVESFPWSSDFLEKYYNHFTMEILDNQYVMKDLNSQKIIISKILPNIICEGINLLTPMERSIEDYAPKDKEELNSLLLLFNI